LLEQAAALRHAGTSFVMATVVRSVKPASARAGDRALLFGDREQLGWVGGGCVHTSLDREARLALRDGTPRLVRLAPEAELSRTDDGVVSYPMTCHSGGTLEVYLEPVLPAPELIVLGESPVADAMTALAAPLGFRVLKSLDAVAASSVLQDTWVVVAGMSSDEDHPAARAALDRGLPYVAMVASRRRTEAFVAELRADGVGDEAMARLRSPAGLDIGAATGAEIALSILAEIVQRRRSLPRASAAATDAAPAESAMAQDPICGMEVEIASARWTATRDGQTFYFCAPGCRRTFLATA
jgi:xanthine dehydrogenase accessory factor